MKHLVFIITVAGIAIALFYLLFYLFSWYFPTKISSTAMDRFYEWKEIYGEDKAREMTVTWLKQKLLVKDAGIEEEYNIWVKYWTAFPESISIAPSQEELKKKEEERKSLF